MDTFLLLFVCVCVFLGVFFHNALCSAMYNVLVSSSLSLLQFRCLIVLCMLCSLQILVISSLASGFIPLIGRIPLWWYTVPSRFNARLGLCLFESKMQITKLAPLTVVGTHSLLIRNFAWLT